MTSMTPERWQRMKGVLYVALEPPTEQRAEFLDRVCSGEDSLRQEVDSMLSSGDQACSSLLQSSRRRVPLSPGTRLGHYEVHSLLGAGGMGDVYRGHDPRLDRDVAVKVLPHVFSEDPERLRRFEQEGRAAAALNHPNIVAIYDVGTTNEGIPYVVSELLEGETLRQCLKRGPLPVRKTVDLALQMASGLAAAHDKGIIHRDLKPENLFLTKSGHLKILDFGLAKLVRSPISPEAGTLTEGTSAGAVMGTMGYMPPEQVRGLAADQRSDIFAAGAIVYEMLSGKRAFRGETHADTIDAILNQDPPALSETNPSVPPAFERTVRRCLEKNPDERFHSVRDVAFAIEALTDLPSATQHAALGGDSRRLRWAKWVGVLALVLAAVSIGLYLRRSSVRLTEKDTIVLADFTNSTGDPVFDDTLKQALAVGLQQSPFLNILSEQKVQETLGLMGRPPGERLNEGTAREVCQRTASAALLVGSISNLGTEYVLGLNALNCRTGDRLALEQVQATKKENVLKALDQVTVKIRGILGESLGTVEKYETPIQEATTSSLDALKAYSVGMKTLSEKGEVAAIPFFEHAIELDPNFAFAYAQLGGIYIANLEEPDLAAKNIRKAYELRDRISERERLYITGVYYVSVTGELEKALQSCEVSAQAYPRDSASRNLAGLIYLYMGQYEKSVAEEREAIRLAPDNIYAYSNLMEGYIGLDRVEEAKAVYQQAINHRLDGVFLHDDMYVIAFLRGDAEEMKRQVDWSAGKPGIEDVLLSAQSDTEGFYGHRARAEAFSRQATESAQGADLKETAALWELNAALREAEFGNPVKAEQEAMAGLTIASTRDVQILAALALARAGDITRAKTLSVELEKQFPANTALNRYWLPIIRAYLEIRLGKPANALRLLQPVSTVELAFPAPQFGPGPPLYSIYVRGQAYLLLNHDEEAANEFQKILTHRNMVGNSLLFSVAHLQLARARSLSGDVPGARKYYQDFLALWKDADPDIPILKQAKAEYAKLP